MYAGPRASPLVLATFDSAEIAEGFETDAVHSVHGAHAAHAAVVAHGAHAAHLTDSAMVERSAVFAACAAFAANV